MHHSLTPTLALATVVALAAACQPNGSQPTAQPQSDLYDYDQPPPASEPVTRAQTQPDPMQDEAMADADEPEGLAQDDQEFIDEALRANVAQIDLGRIAMAKARGKPVKELARKLVGDHQKMKDDLVRIARDKGAAIVEGTPEDAREDMQKLEELSTKKVDAAYVEIVDDDHEKLVELLREYAEEDDADERDPDLRAWAASTLPLAEDHVAHIEAVESGKPYRPSPPQAAATPKR
jgi:putative membrane protein